MIKLILAVIFTAVVLLLIIVTIAGVLEAREMEWDHKTLIKQEKDEDDELLQ